MTHTEREPLSDYWQTVAMELINTRHRNWDNPHDVAAWIGRASGVLAEMLRVHGNTDGIDAIIGAFGETKDKTRVTR